MCGVIFNCFKCLSSDLFLLPTRQDVCSEILPAFGDSLDFLMLHDQLVAALLSQVVDEVDHNRSDVGGMIVQLEPEND